MLTFNRNYFILTILFFLIEVLIALFVRDQIIRPYLGDSIVVILIYCFIKTFLKLPIKSTTIYVLLFSYFIEVLQYFKLTTLLHLENSRIAKIVLGSSFSWIDLVAYTLGAALIIVTEKALLSYRLKSVAKVN